MSDESSHRRALSQAYRDTTYRVDAPGGAIGLRIGRPVPRLDALLRAVGVESWAFVTAENPGSLPASQEENQRDLRRLMDEIRGSGRSWYSGAGVGDSGEWPPERSILILGIEAAEARDLGRRYGQVAVVVGRRGEVPELLFCDDAGA